MVVLLSKVPQVRHYAHTLTNEPVIYPSQNAKQVSLSLSLSTTILSLSFSWPVFHPTTPPEGLAVLHQRSGVNHGCLGLAVISGGWSPSGQRWICFCPCCCIPLKEILANPAAYQQSQKKFRPMASLSLGQRSLRQWCPSLSQ